MGPSTPANSGTKRQHGLHTPEQSTDDYPQGGFSQPPFSRSTTDTSLRGANTVVADAGLTEDPYDMQSSPLHQRTQARVAPKQASPPAVVTTTQATPSMADIIAAIPELARLYPQFSQFSQQQQQQEQALQSAVAPTTPPPTSIPNASAIPAAQPRVVHVSRGHQFGKVMIKGKNAKVQQGNVFGKDTDPNLVKNHDYGVVEIEEEAEAPNLHQGDLDHEGFGVFMNGSLGPSI